MNVRLQTPKLLKETQKTIQNVVIGEGPHNSGNNDMN